MSMDLDRTRIPARRFRRRSSQARSTLGRNREGLSDAKLIVLVGVEGEAAKRLERISEARGTKAADVVAELLRDAERSLA
jgi:hypothetical protein